MTHPALHLAKQYIRTPIAAEALRIFCHPGKGHLFSRPFSGDGFVWAANGFIALRIDLVKLYGNEPEPNPSALARVSCLPWSHHLAPHALVETKPQLPGRPRSRSPWRRLDDKALTLWQGGPVQLWAPIDSPSPRILADRFVWVSDRPLILGLIQLALRLPGAEIYTSIGHNTRFALLRFNGGRGLIHMGPPPGMHPNQMPPPEYSLFPYLSDPLPGGLVP